VQLSFTTPRRTAVIVLSGGALALTAFAAGLTARALGGGAESPAYVLALATMSLALAGLCATIAFHLTRRATGTGTLPAAGSVGAALAVAFLATAPVYGTTFAVGASALAALVTATALLLWARRPAGGSPS